MTYNEWKEAIKLLQKKGWKRSPGPNWSYYKELNRQHEGRIYTYWVFIYKYEIKALIPLAALLDEKENQGKKSLNKMILRDKVKRKWGVYDD